MHLSYDPTRLMQSERYCNCKDRDCRCGEKNEHEWAWDEALVTRSSQLSERNLEVKFHPGYSTGTAMVRGNRSMAKGRHHFWEVKMVTPVYGTDVMVGVGTSKVDLDGARLVFCSLLGKDNESWGFSYKGYLQHGGETRDYAKDGFGQGSLVGVHLDTWKGTLQFFLNRKPLGIAFVGLRCLDLYPMVSSTAAQSRVRITHSCSAPASLEMECLGALKPLQRAYLIAAFPGLRYLSQSIFADILKNNSDESDDEYPDEFTILEDFDLALIGWNRRRKRKKLSNGEEAITVARCMCDNCGTMIAATSAPPLCATCRQ